MPGFTLVRRHSDYSRVKVAALVGNTALAKRLRRDFLALPLILSFEVSPLSGEMYIGYDRAGLACSEQKLALARLCEAYFPNMGIEHCLRA